MKSNSEFNLGHKHQSIYNILGGREDYAIVFNRKSELTALYQRGKAGWVAVDNMSSYHRPGRYYIVIPPGLLTLRRVNVESGSKKDALAAVEMEAEASLLEKLDKGYMEKMTRSLENGMTGVFAWIPADFLDRCYQKAEERNWPVAGILAPELCLDSPDPRLFLYSSREAYYVFYIFQKAPLLCQTAFSEGASLNNCLMMLATQIEEYQYPIPVDVVIWADDKEQGDSMETTLTAVFKGNNVLRVLNWSEALSLMSFTGGGWSSFLFSSRECQFQNAIRRWDHTPLPAEDRLKQTLKLTWAVSAGILGCMIFLFSILTIYEKDMIKLEKEVGKIKVMAHKSEGAALRIQDLNKEIDTIRMFSVNKPYMLDLMKIIGNSTPLSVKLKSIVITDHGKITIQGVSKEYIDLISLIENLNSMMQLGEPKLNSAEKDKETGMFNFSMEIDAPTWYSVLAKQAEPEKQPGAKESMDRSMPAEEGE